MFTTCLTQARNGCTKYQISDHRCGDGDMSSRSYWTKRRRTLNILKSFESSSSIEKINGCDFLSEVNPESNLPINLNHEEDEVFMDCLNLCHDYCHIRDHSDGDSSDDSDTAEEEDDNECAKLAKVLCEWALRNDVPQKTLSDLLCALQEFHPDLPKQAHTLLQTAKIVANVK